MPLIPNYRKTRLIHQYGATADRPAATDVLEGTLYYSTDDDELSRSNGSSWDTLTLGGGTPGGSDTYLQFNDGGVFGGDAGLTYNKTTDTLALAGLLDLSGASAGQIKFPASQNAASNANTLDDYEEGLDSVAGWTPTIGGTTSQSGQVYSVQDGHYIKIGRLVVVWGRVALSTLGTITGTVQLKGLPFTVANEAGGTFGSLQGAWRNTTNSFVTVQFQPVVNTTAMNIVGIGAAATDVVVSLVQADLSNTTEFRFGVMYLATA